jgi:hypothetical protein
LAFHHKLTLPTLVGPKSSVLRELRLTARLAVPTLLAQ